MALQHKIARNLLLRQVTSLMLRWLWRCLPFAKDTAVTSMTGVWNNPHSNCRGHGSATTCTAVPAKSGQKQCCHIQGPTDQMAAKKDSAPPNIIACHCFGMAGSMKKPTERPHMPP